MTTGDFLDIQPSELKFSFEVKKQSSASIQLANQTDKSVGFKVKTTNPRGYCVRPNAGVVLPNSMCNISVTMQAQDNPPLDMHCKDKFLIQSVAVPNGTMSKDVTQEMFNAEEGKVIGESRLKVIYVPADHHSLLAEGDEEGNSLGTSSTKDERKSSISDVAWNVVSRLNDENDSLIKQNQRLVTQLELMRKAPGQGQGQGQGRGVPRMVLLFGLFLGILMGYFIPK